MISLEHTERALNKLGGLKFFPTKPGVVAEIGRDLNKTCQNDAEAETLIDAVLDRFTEWPGVRAVKELYQEKIAVCHAPETGCLKCAPPSIGGLPGHRRCLYVYKRLPDGRRGGLVETVWCIGSGWDEERDLERRYPPNQFDMLSSMGLCTCSLGIRLKKFEDSPRSDGRHTAVAPD